MSARPGWGERHPAIAAVLAKHAAVDREDALWGDIPLRISAYTTTPELPDELVTSIRCIVRVGDGVVVTSNADGETHPMPGGRREADETWSDTAAREVHEETGWLIDLASLRQVGWLHLEYRSPMSDDWPFPHPDALQAVFTASAERRDGGVDTPWVDIEGHELASRVPPLDEARSVVTDALSWVFLDQLG